MNGKWRWHVGRCLLDLVVMTPIIIVYEAVCIRPGLNVDARRWHNLTMSTYLCRHCTMTAECLHLLDLCLMLAVEARDTESVYGCLWSQGWGWAHETECRKWNQCCLRERSVVRHVDGVCWCWSGRHKTTDAHCQDWPYCRCILRSNKIGIDPSYQVESASYCLALGECWGLMAAYQHQQSEHNFQQESLCRPRRGWQHRSTRQKVIFTKVANKITRLQLILQIWLTTESN